MSSPYRVVNDGRVCRVFLDGREVAQGVSVGGGECTYFATCLASGAWVGYESERVTLEVWASRWV